MDKPIAWYDPTNGAVSTDKDSPLFTPLGQVLPLFLEEQQITADCPNCEYHRQRAQLWRDEAYKQAGHPLPEREKYEPYAFEAFMYSNDRIKIDPVTGNVSIGTPQQEAKDEPVAIPENFMDALRFDVAMRDAREWEKVDMREHAEGNLGIGTAPPPQRTWVELDEEDYIKAYELCDFDKDAAFEFFEAKLKEKNT